MPMFVPTRTAPHGQRCERNDWLDCFLRCRQRLHIWIRLSAVSYSRANNGYQHGMSVLEFGAITSSATLAAPPSKPGVQISFADLPDAHDWDWL
jgi:hypothetical protein